MKLKDILEKIENGSVHVLVYSKETGEVLINTIWYNTINENILALEVEKIEVTDYTLIIEVK